MKHPIEWHLQCLESQQKHYGREYQEALDRMRISTLGLEDCRKYEAKIAIAISKGLNEFDRDKMK